EPGEPANLRVGRHLHGEELPPGPDEPAPPETGAGPDDDQLYPDQTPEVLRELGTRRVDAGRPGEARCIPPVQRGQYHDCQGAPDARLPAAHPVDRAIACLHRGALINCDSWCHRPLLSACPYAAGSYYPGHGPSR